MTCLLSVHTLVRCVSQENCLLLVDTSEPGDLPDAVNAGALCAEVGCTVIDIDVVQRVLRLGIIVCL